MFELYGPFAILIPVTLLAVVVALAFGLRALYTGGEDRSRSNKLMRLRVLLQFIAVLVLVAFFYWRTTQGQG
jgi:nitrogen fixation-related uncharacterized protein